MSVPIWTAASAGVQAIGALGAGVQAIGALRAGRAQAAALGHQAALIDRHAQEQMGVAQVQAERIRRAGRLQLGETRSALAGAGVRVDTGSGLLVQEEVIRRAEQDAYAAILSGELQARTLRHEAELTRMGAREARRAGNIGAATTLLAGAARYSQWNRRMPAGRRIGPVVDFEG
ncbi:MAG TPA: hypothetical protein VFH17_01030 [Coriobacteriia bacterium]|nr:hypothetical protein [Coriobacteriia bacterium]